YSCLCCVFIIFFFFFSSRRRHTRFSRDWSSDVCSSDLYSCICHRDGDLCPSSRGYPLPNHLKIWSQIEISLSQFAKDHTAATTRSEERRVGKGVDIGGSRIMKKKNKRKKVGYTRADKKT